jgi:drug/metabolite transporter (DMT)-like permease
VGKVISTLVTVIVAVGASAALWVGANLLFNQTRSHWRRFTAIAFGLVGFLLAAVLHGNRVTRGSGEGFLTWIWLPVVAGVVFAAVGLVLESTSDPRRRQVIGVVACVGVGVAIALMIRISTGRRSRSGRWRSPPSVQASTACGGDRSQTARWWEA